MKTREEILKEFIDVKGGFMMKQDQRALLLNPKLLLEVMLDIRELLTDLTKKLAK